jgi:hypothetical protein
MFKKLFRVILLTGGVMALFAVFAVFSCSPVNSGNATLSIENSNAYEVDNVYWNGVYFGYIEPGDSAYASVPAGTSAITYQFYGDTSDQFTSPGTLTVHPGDSDYVYITTNTND